MLQETTAANPGIQYRTFDRNNADEVRSFAARLANDHTLKAIVSRRGDDGRDLAKTCLRQTLTTFFPGVSSRAA